MRGWRGSGIKTARRQCAESHTIGTRGQMYDVMLSEYSFYTSFTRADAWIRISGAAPNGCSPAKDRRIL
jgi:hypothetical protein